MGNFSNEGFSICKSPKRMYVRVSNNYTINIYVIAKFMQVDRRFFFKVNKSFGRMINTKSVFLCI